MGIQSNERVVVFLAFVVLAVVVRATLAWQWTPEDEHPCNVPRLSVEEVYRRFPKGLPPLYQDPIVISSNTAERNAHLRSITSRDSILQQFTPGFNVTLSSSNALSERRRTVPLRTYLEEIASVPETTPLQLSNESWYLFGETYTEPWQHLLRWYELPPCQTCQRRLSAISFGIGNRGSGVQWHTHGPGFSEALHGRKHWIMYPQTHPPANLHKDKSSRQWMEFEYPKAVADDSDFYECTRELLLSLLLFFALSQSLVALGWRLSLKMVAACTYHFVVRSSFLFLFLSGGTKQWIREK